MNWFTADTHFGHENVIRFCKRPFENLQQMDSVLIQNWNNKIHPEDTVYMLGDFAWRNMKFYVEQLNGNKHLIRGSHDKQVGLLSHFFVSVSDILHITIESQPIVLCHYSMRVWSASHYNSWQLYGHSHGRLDPVGKQMDVGVDCNNYYPVSFEDIKKHMEQRPDNFNKVVKNHNPGDDGFREASNDNNT